MGGGQVSYRLKHILTSRGGRKAHAANTLVLLVVAGGALVVVRFRMEELAGVELITDLFVNKKLTHKQISEELQKTIQVYVV